MMNLAVKQLSSWLGKQVSTYRALKHVSKSIPESRGGSPRTVHTPLPRLRNIGITTVCCVGWLAISGVDGSAPPSTLSLLQFPSPKSHNS